MKINYKDGVKHGAAYYYRENGELLGEEIYENGVKSSSK